MSVILKRTLTLKSKIGFGKYKEYTVEHLIGMRKEFDLISMYYKLEKIDFNEEVIGILRIPASLRIEKPGKDSDTYYLCIEELGYIRKIDRRREAIKDREYRGFTSGMAMLPKTKPESKAKLKGKNNGRR